MKKRIIMAICSLLIVGGGIGMASIQQKELPVSKVPVEEAFAKAEETEEVAENLKFCEEGCILTEGHEGHCVLQPEKEDIEVILKTASVERDLKVKFVNKATGKVISGADFKLQLTDSSRKTKEYYDHDNDGVIWVKDIEGGSYTVAMMDLEGYVTAQSQKADVKKEIEYQVIEIADEIVQESQIDVSREDAEYGGKDQDESTLDPVVPEDTVEFVASSKEENHVVGGEQEMDGEDSQYDEMDAPVYAAGSEAEGETETVTVYYGWQTIDGKTYYFDKNGNKVTGTQVIQGTTYTFDENGVRQGTIGIDVSKYQTDVDWEKVKNAGINFVIIRCGYRGYGSGKLVEDEMFESHITGAKAAGLRVGIYFFSQAIDEAEAVEEASMAVELADKYGIDMPIAIDSEYANGGDGRADGLSKEERTTVTKAFCETVKNAGHTPMVYASKSWFSDHLEVSELNSYRIWVAHYADECGYQGTYHIWQHTSKGTVDGISGNVDMNKSSI